MRVNDNVTPEGRLDQVGPELDVSVGDAKQTDMWAQRYNKLLTLHNDRLRELSNASAALKCEVETVSNEIASLNRSHHMLDSKLDEGFSQIHDELKIRTDTLGVQLGERQREFNTVHDERFAELANRFNKHSFELNARLVEQSNILTQYATEQAEQYKQCIEGIGVLRDALAVLIDHVTKPSAIERFIVRVKRLFGAIP